MKRKERLSQSEYARSRGVSRQFVSARVKEGIIPLHAGKIDPDEADAILDAVSTNPRRGSEISAKILKARLRVLEAEASRREIHLQRDRGEVVLVEDSARVLEDIVVAIRAKLLALPNKLAPQVVACSSTAEVAGLLQEGVYQALDELAALGSTGGNDGKA